MFKRFRLIMLVMLFTVGVMAAASFPAIIQATTELDPNTIIALVLPLVVWLASWAANALKAKLGQGGFSGTVLVSIIVPLLSWVSAEIFAYLADYQGNFWGLFGLGLLGTFVNELVKQWKQSVTKTQTPTKNKLIG